MAKWIDYSMDERKALIAKTAQARNIDEAAAEKDWWVTAVLFAVFRILYKQTRFLSYF